MNLGPPCMYDPTPNTSCIKSFLEYSYAKEDICPRHVASLSYKVDAVGHCVVHGGSPTSVSWGKFPTRTTQPTSRIGSLTSTFAGLKEDTCTKDSLAADQR
ncbi:hypothetical protein TNCV_3634451 [Trichonephila clavipes]|nr:hypothetical protein TNCV_3634451 [Trichonephila clavipes]